MLVKASNSSTPEITLSCSEDSRFDMPPCLAHPDVMLFVPGVHNSSRRVSCHRSRSQDSSLRMHGVIGGVEGLTEWTTRCFTIKPHHASPADLCRSPEGSTTSTDLATTSRYNRLADTFDLYRYNDNIMVCVLIGESSQLQVTVEALELQAGQQMMTAIVSINSDFLIFLSRRRDVSTLASSSTTSSTDLQGAR
jgi:hypothetical protein